MNKLYEFLKVSGLDTEEKVRSNILCKFSTTKVFDILENCFYLSNMNESIENPGLFDFSANYSLSGGHYPCYDIGCRTQNIQDLITFSLLYSDSVLIANIFDYFYYKKRIDEFKYHDEEFNFKYGVAGDLIIALRIRKAVEAGYIRMNNTVRILCKNHSDNLHKTEKHLQLKIDKVFDSEWSKIKKKLKVVLFPDGVITTYGPNDYVPHGETTYRHNVLPTVFKKYLRNIPTELPYRLFDDTGLRKQIFMGSWNSLMLQKYDQTLDNNLTFLTNQKIESDIIEKINSSERPDLANSKNIVEGLTHSVPFLRGVNSEKLINLRKTEGDAFERYRFSLKRVIDQLSGESNLNKFKQAMKDSVIPEVENLTRTLNSSLSKIKHNTVGSIIGNSIILAVGLMSGDLVKTSGILATKTATDIRKLFSDWGNTSSEIKLNSYYFLWKIKELAQT